VKAYRQEDGEGKGLPKALVASAGQGRSGGDNFCVISERPQFTRGGGRELARRRLLDMELPQRRGARMAYYKKKKTQ